MMKMRVVDIRKTINRYLIDIHGIERTREKFGGMENLFKLRYLFKKCSDIDEKVLMRMNDVVQSFDVMNAPGSENLQIIRKKLEDDKDWNLKSNLVLSPRKE